MTQEQINAVVKKLIWAIAGLVLINSLITRPAIGDTLLNAIRPVILAFAIAYLVDPIVNFLAVKLKTSRKKSIGITLVLLISGMFLVATMILPNLFESFNDFNKLFSANTSGDSIDLGAIEEKLGFEITNETINEIQKTLDSAMTQISSKLTSAVLSLIGSLMAFTSSAVSFIVSFIIAIYMLLSKSDLNKRIDRMTEAFCSKDHYAYLKHVSKTANGIFSSFFVGKIIDSAIIGVLCWLIMLIARIPNSMTFGFLVGFTNMIPYFGPVIGAVPCVLITLITSPGKAIWVLIIIIALQQFDGLVLGPKILGDKLGVDAFWIITAVTVGGAIWGVMGMLLGVPVVILFKQLIEESVERRLTQKKKSEKAV